LGARHLAIPEWHQVVDDLAEPSEIEVEQDGRRALLRTAPGPTIDAFAEPSVSMKLDTGLPNVESDERS
jgi:hypothetical protein